MHAHEVKPGRLGPVRLMDSITQVEARDAGGVAVSGSHGGTSSGRYALSVPLALACFNDAGVGKDGAGIEALRMLQAQGRAGLAVSHLSARIGDAADTWASGVISHVNAAAAALGLAPGQRLCEVLGPDIGDTGDAQDGSQRRTT